MKHQNYENYLTEAQVAELPDFQLDDNDFVTEEDIDKLFLQESGQRDYINEDPPE